MYSTYSYLYNIPNTINRENTTYQVVSEENLMIFFNFIEELLRNKI
jgi:hypothetical protein